MATKTKKPAKGGAPTTELVTDHQKKQAAMLWLTERARSLSEATGIPLGDLGSWLLYVSQKEQWRKDNARVLADKRAPKGDKEHARTSTPETEAEGLLEDCASDVRTACTWIEDIVAVGAKYDNDYDKPLVGEKK